MHRRRTPRKQGLAFLAPLLALVAGCPTRFDPRAEPLQAGSSDPAARQAFKDARARLDAGAFADAGRQFHDFRARFASDPLVESALLWEARADLGAGDAKGAAALVEPLAARAAGDPVGDRARFVLGLALARSSQPAELERARALLAPFAQVIAPGDEATELHAALAEAAAGLADVPGALAEYALYFRDARPIERAYVRERAAKLVEPLGDADAAKLWETSPRDSLACALLGARLAAARRAAGDEAAARTITDESDAARRRFGFDQGGRASASADLAVGLVLPLSGRNRLLGERALRGALLAADALPASGQTLELRVRDSESSPQRAAQAVEELARDGVVAVVGSPDRSEAVASAAAADAAGVPLLELAPDEAPHGGLTFKLLRPNPARAEALARQAVKLGAARVVTLYPDNAYGRKMAAEFARALGHPPAVEIAFDEKATTFIAQAKQVVKASPDAVFVPAPASQLALIASQLAASGVLRTQGSTRKGGAFLLATADGLTPQLLAGAGRYVQGAVLAPVFYADAADARLAPFVDKFRAAYGDEPGAADALAYDAVTAVKLALTRFDLGRGRAALAQAVAAARDPGVTGDLGFTATGERAGTPQLFIVDGTAIRALR